MRVIGGQFVEIGYTDPAWEPRERIVLANQGDHHYEANFIAAAILATSLSSLNKGMHQGSTGGSGSFGRTRKGRYDRCHRHHEANKADAEKVRGIPNPPSKDDGNFLGVKPQMPGFSAQRKRRFTGDCPWASDLKNWGHTHLVH